MRRAAVLLCALALTAIPAVAFALSAPADTTGAELASARSGLDGEVVRFEGEVVSESLRGGAGHVWVNVLSEGTAIGVWTTEALAADLEVFGRFSHTGDVVRVTGTFNEGCDQHGGDLDVHATALELVRRGEARARPAQPWKLAVGLIGLAVAAVGWRRMRRSEEGIST
jgi:tRNA(Ile2) C34 agmatinyltransferase TiaS